MASLVHRPRDHKWVQFSFAGKRRTIKLGKAPEFVGEQVRDYIEAILAAKKSNVAMDAKTRLWVDELRGVRRAQLERMGLIEPLPEP